MVSLQGDVGRLPVYHLVHVLHLQGVPAGHGGLAVPGLLRTDGYQLAHQQGQKTCWQWLPHSTGWKIEVAASNGQFERQATYYQQHSVGLNDMLQISFWGYSRYCHRYLESIWRQYLVRVEGHAGCYQLTLSWVLIVICSKFSRIFWTLSQYCILSNKYWAKIWRACRLISTDTQLTRFVLRRCLAAQLRLHRGLTCGRSPLLSYLHTCVMNNNINNNNKDNSNWLHNWGYTEVEHAEGRRCIYTCIHVWWTITITTTTTIFTTATGCTTEERQFNKFTRNIIQICHTQSNEGVLGKQKRPKMIRGGTSRMKEQTSFNHFVIIISRNLYSFLLLSMEEWLVEGEVHLQELSFQTNRLPPEI